MLKGGKIFALGDSKSLIVGAKGDGSLAFYTGFYGEVSIDLSDRASAIAWFSVTFPGWSPLWLELFRQCHLPLLPRPQYCMPMDQTWEALSNLTMLGDAAHLMPPYAGEGVNMAMLDALELSKSLFAFDDPLAGIRTYETAMRARAASTAAMTMESTVALHSPEAMSFMLSVLGR